MIAIVLVVAIAAAAGGFFAGTKYQQSKRGQFITLGNNQGKFGNMMAVPGGNGARGGFRPVTGEIIKSDNTSITVSLADGSSKIILLSTSTQINKAEVGSKADLVIGTQIAVFGSENADGSVTAQNVQINPSTMGSKTPEPTK